MTEPTSERTWQYDLFISYANFDEELHAFVSHIEQRIKQTFHQLTGIEAKIFLDATEITSAMLWQQRIEIALNSSAALIIVETPSYYTSSWCQRELDIFLILEAQRRSDRRLLPYESLIFPIIRSEAKYPLSEDESRKHRRSELSSRQSTNLVNVKVPSQQFYLRIDRLVSDIVSILEKLARPRSTAVEPGSPLSETQEKRAVTIPLVTTYSGHDSKKLLQLMSDAQAITVIGIGNEDVTEILEAAILEKKRKSNDQSAFWDHLHIVFLADELLAHVNDSLSTEFPDRSRVLQERLRRVAWSRRRLMSLLLRHGASDRWTIYSHPYTLPFVGILFVMPDGRRIVQLQIMRPSRNQKGHLSIEFIDRVDQFFESAFREIIEASNEEHEIVLVGAPDLGSDTFFCRGSRFRRSILVEGQSINDWIAAVVAITWRKGKNGPEPLLQLNTPRNSTREIGKISHVSGYINALDYSASSGLSYDAYQGEIVLPNSAAERAVRRELLQDFGINIDQESMKLLGTQRFYYSDKENLFFFIFSQEIDATHQFTNDAQMFAWSLEELVAVRRNHVLNNVKSVLTSDLTSRQRHKAGELVTMNLIAQGDAGLAEAVNRALTAEGLPQDLERDLDSALQSTRIYKYTFGRELQAEGIAGLQYRIFYSTLLPVYRSLRIPGAEALLAEIRDDSQRASAMVAIEQMYDDESYINSLPIEV